MCEQCLAGAVLVKSAVLPGFSLMRAETGSTDWPKGHYGLVEQNDPLFVFEGPLVLDPSINLTDDELNAMPGFPDGYDAYKDLAERLTDATLMPALAGYEFVSACIQAGYNPKEHGTEIGYWLGHHLASQVPA
ncbi:hypothetical protein D3C71_25950 [compost metagenome]